MEICALSSGSGGNATVIRSGATAVLLDAGVSCRTLLSRLSSVNMDPDSIGAILISHGHNDHIRGIVAIARRLGARVFASASAIKQADLSAAIGEEQVSVIEAGSGFRVGELNIDPFPVPHDAPETFGFTITDGRSKLGIATDLGSLTMDVVQGFMGCDALVIESNHDERMLLEGPYPLSLKKRVRGPEGHLSNTDTAELLRCVAHRDLKHVVLAHLSAQNNRPELTLAAARKALKGRAAPRVSLGWQRRAGEVVRL